MTNLRFVLLATTALTAMQFASSASHAQSAAPIVVAQAQTPELGPDGKPKQPPKGAPAAPRPRARPHPRRRQHRLTRQHRLRQLPRRRAQLRRHPRRHRRRHVQLLLRRHHPLPLRSRRRRLRPRRRSNMLRPLRRRHHPRRVRLRPRRRLPQRLRSSTRRHRRRLHRVRRHGPRLRRRPRPRLPPRQHQRRDGPRLPRPPHLHRQPHLRRPRRRHAWHTAGWPPRCTPAGSSRHASGSRIIARSRGYARASDHADAQCRHSDRAVRASGSGTDACASDGPRTPSPHRRLRQAPGAPTAPSGRPGPTPTPAPSATPAPTATPAPGGTVPGRQGGTPPAGAPAAGTPADAAAGGRAAPAAGSPCRRRSAIYRVWHGGRSATARQGAIRSADGYVRFPRRAHDHHARCRRRRVRRSVT